MKRKITAITIALMLVILTTTTAFASTHLTYELQNIMREYNDYTLIGDATNDKKINIDDATAIQQILAEFADDKNGIRMRSTEINHDPTRIMIKYTFDVNNDDVVNINDVTDIQRVLAEMKDKAPNIGKTIREVYGPTYATVGLKQTNTTVPTVNETTSPVTEPVTQTTTQPVTQPETQPSTTAHTHVYTTTIKKKLIEESYTFNAGGEWEMHVFCRKCGEDLTIMHKKWMEENGVKPGDFYADLASWFQNKHMKSTLMKSPTTGKLCAVLTDCQGEMWGAGIGKPYERTKFSAYQDWVYIGGQEYTYPAIYKYIYTEKCACGDVKRVYAKQTAYPSRADIVAGTYTEKLVDVEP